VQPVARADAGGLLASGLEVGAVLDQRGAERLHGGIFLARVAVRHVDHAAQTGAGGGKGHRLAVVATGRTDDARHRALPGQPRLRCGRHGGVHGAGGGVQGGGVGQHAGFRGRCADRYCNGARPAAWPGGQHAPAPRRTRDVRLQSAPLVDR